MGIASIVLGVAAFLFMMGGFILTIVPGVGTVLSFAAPVLALAGIVTGGIGLSRAKRDGQPAGAATGGLVVSIVAFIPAFIVAITCGLCNACMTAGMMMPQNRAWRDGAAAPYDPTTTPWDGGDSGASGFVDPNAPPGQGPPPAFPPPPLPPGPSEPLETPAPGEAAEPSAAPQDPGISP
jgi:hypothetical protein